MDKETRMKIARFLGWLALFFGGIFLLIVISGVSRAFLASDEDLLSNYIVTITYEEFLKGNDIELITSPGVDTHITINLAKSMQGHWKSDDLLFFVEDPTTSRQIAQINLSQSDHWGEALTAEKLSEPVSVSFDWTVPTETSIGSRLSGILSGTVEYPSAESGYKFRNQILTLKRYISIVMVSRSELVKNIRSYFLDSSKILALLSTPFLLLGALILFITNRRLRAKPNKVNTTYKIPPCLKKVKTSQIRLRSISDTDYLSGESD